MPISLKVPEFYQAISRGTAEGAMTNVQVLQAVKIGELLNYYMEGPLGGAVSIVFMNRAKFDALPSEAKKAIEDNSGEATSRLAARTAIASESVVMEELLKDPKKKKVKLEGAAWEKWRKVLEPLSAEWAQSVPNGTALIDALRAELAVKK